MKILSTQMMTRERAKKVPLPFGINLIANGLLITATMLLTHTFSSEAQAEILKEKITQEAKIKEMVLIPKGEFVMGNEGIYTDELPRHTVRMNAFYLDAHEVTNAQFADFIKATEYVTRTERDGHCWAYFNGETDWQYAAGTNWRHPQGPTSTIEDKMNHPVVCVNWEDAATYAKWAGKRLPTEAEWEYAARTNSPGHFIANTISDSHDHSHHLVNAPILSVTDQSPSAKSHNAGSQHHTTGSKDNLVTAEANVWQGHWPEHNALGDGFYYTAPAASFAANKWGVYDMLGNVWEWTADWYDSSYYAVSPIADPQGPTTGEKRLARGGSWFCSPNYCGAYSTHYRGASQPDHAFNNVGFRCAMDVPVVRSNEVKP